MKKLFFKALFLAYLNVYLFGQTLGNLDTQNLKKIYPDHIKSATSKIIVWQDETIMPLHINQFNLCRYNLGRSVFLPLYIPAKEDSLCEIHESFLKKMYGNTPEEVEKNLVTIDWMPRIFGAGIYKLQMTKINGIDKKIKKISDELEQLVIKKPHLRVFLENPGGGFKWRNVANTNRLSNHSFGIALDINAHQSRYWQWDLQKLGMPLEYGVVPPYRNVIPWDIVSIFEKHGFIWGGRWPNYDTMHFEYRPEMLFVT